MVCCIFHHQQALLGLTCKHDVHNEGTYKSCNHCSDRRTWLSQSFQTIISSKLFNNHERQKHHLTSDHKVKLCRYRDSLWCKSVVWGEKSRASIYFLVRLIIRITSLFLGFFFFIVCLIFIFIFIFIFFIAKSGAKGGALRLIVFIFIFIFTLHVIIEYNASFEPVHVCEGIIVFLKVDALIDVYRSIIDFSELISIWF